MKVLYDIKHSKDDMWRLLFANTVHANAGYKRKHFDHLNS